MGKTHHENSKRRGALVAKLIVDKIGLKKTLKHVSETKRDIL